MTEEEEEEDDELQRRVMKAIASSTPEEAVGILEGRTPVAIQRLIDEVRAEPDRPAGAQMFDRAHNRHNR